MPTPIPPGGLTPPVDADVARAVARLNHGQREFFEERAGILEFESGLARAEAEREALAQTREYYGLSG
jgi:hypothetical protein